jgi:hypothetical protein
VDDLTRVLTKRRKAMQTLSHLIRCARLGGRWATCHIAQVRSASSRVIHRLGRWADAVEPCRLPAPVPLPVRVPRLGAVALLPALLLAMLAASPALASRTSGFEATADGRLVDVQVQVDGSTAPLYFPSDGSDRRYFQAFRGRHYALAITNKTGRRIGVLIAVDGLNVVNGQRSRLAADEAMYVLDPWERTVIRGWRSSLQDVRQFVFVDEERSYAERTGQANGDLGWVRVLAFNERGQRWFDYAPGRVNERERGQSEDEVRPFGAREGKDENAPQAQRRDEAGAAPEVQGQEGDLVTPRKSAGSTKLLYGNDAAPAPQSVPGTGWGEKRWDPVRRVWFVPEPFPTDQLVLRYEYASGLRALGITPRGTRDRLWEREHGELGFAQPPRW